MLARPHSLLRYKSTRFALLPSRNEAAWYLPLLRAALAFCRALPPSDLGTICMVAGRGACCYAFCRLILGRLVVSLHGVECLRDIGILAIAVLAAILRPSL